MIGERKEERGGLNEDGEDWILKDFVKNDNGYRYSRWCGLTKIKKAKE